MRSVVAALVIALAALVVAPAASAFTGEQRLLVVRLTWGPEPFGDEHVRDVIAQTDAFMRTSSFGKTWIHGDQTPWLRVWETQPRCDVGTIAAAGRDAARRAGYDLTRFNRFAYLFPRIDCGWTGFGGSAEQIWLNGALTRKLVAHELGHTYGLGHANSWDCDGRVCTSTEYGDPYSTMGRGQGDFNAYEKYELGWVTNVLRADRSGTYVIERPDVPTAQSQALVVTTARSEFWFENRQEQVPFFGGVLPTGVLVRGGPSPLVSPTALVFPSANLLIPDPAGRGRAALLPGVAFGERGAFELAVVSEADGRATLEFRWTDTLRPAAPAIVEPRKRVARRAPLYVAWREPTETGSGIDRYEIRLDGRPVVRVDGDVAGTPVVQLRTPRPGRHRVAVTAVDRAGNRGRTAGRRFAVTTSR